MTNEDHGPLGAKVPTFTFPSLINGFYIFILIISVFFILSQSGNDSALQFLIFGLVSFGYGLLCLLISFLTKSKTVHAIFTLLPPIGATILVVIATIFNKK